MTAATTREVTFSFNGQPHRHPAGTPVAVERHRRNGTIDIRVRGTLHTQNVHPATITAA